MSARTAALWVPDWPVRAVMEARGIPAHTPAATHEGQRLVAVSAVARSSGVRRGMRVRQAREQCPELELMEADDTVAARDFEPVARAVETVVAGLEIARPGLLLMPSAGASRHYGSDVLLAGELITRVAGETGHECYVGIGAGLLTAVLAARDQAVVEDSAAFLGPRSVRDLVHAVTETKQVGAVDTLIGLLHRLGIHTLGALAAVDARAIADRFGHVGSWAHRLACGEDLRPPARRRIEDDIAASAPFEPPLERMDAAAFAARRLAEKLCGDLIARSVIAGRLHIAARSVDGTVHERTWRAGPDALTPARVTDRVRWQLEGWLTASRHRAGPDIAAVSELTITAQEVVAAGAHQPNLWGASSGRDERAHRALARAQGLLGADAVLIATVQGGRDVRDPVHVVPFGEERTPARDHTLPWPGRLPIPRPALVPATPPRVRILDAADRPVVVNARGVLSAPPATIHALGAGNAPSVIRDWAGPWPLVERWWSAQGSSRTYLQVLLGDGRGLLVATDVELWRVEGIYD